MGMGPQDRPQDDIILKDEIAGLAPAVPVRPILEMPLEPYDKKPRLSLRMLMGSVCLTAIALVRYIRA
jgi:hypothetical protein